MTGSYLAASITAAATPTPSPTQLAAAGPSTLSWGQTLGALLIMGVALLFAGLVVIRARSQAGGRGADSSGTGSDKGSSGFEAGASVVRSWIAISLVIGLLLFCVLTFAVEDQTLRSTLIGGLTASVGSAIAYYFSSKSAEQARQDLMDTVTGTEIVPDLRGMTEAKAAGILGKTSLKLETDPNGSKDPNAIVESQRPDRGMSAPQASSVQVTLSSPTQPAPAPPPVPATQPQAPA